MALNFIWIGFILIGFTVAAVKVMMGQTALFGQMLTGLFDMTKPSEMSKPVLAMSNRPVSI